MISPNFQYDINFHQYLYRIDLSLAEVVLNSNCERCGGKLHHADFPRKPHGLSSEFWEIYSERISFCCSVCNKRHTPPSVRFFGRYWYVAPILLIMSALIRPITGQLTDKIYRHFGIHICKSTLKRWRQWWNETFLSGTFWQQMKGILPPDMNLTVLMPRALIRLYRQPIRTSLIKFLQFITPLSYGFHKII